jgi:mannose-6-phosphate isomerase-like protein (cupin superfamily)
VTLDESFQFLRKIDLEQLNATPATERYSQTLLDGESGARHCTIAYIRTPAGGGSPAGMHLHEVDQIFLVIEGRMSVEIAGVLDVAEPGTLIVFPAGVPHRNWNDGDVPTIHVAFNVPMPDASRTFAIPVSDGPAATGDAPSGR